MASASASAAAGATSSSAGAGPLAATRDPSPTLQLQLGSVGCESGMVSFVPLDEARYARPPAKLEGVTFDLGAPGTYPVVAFCLGGPEFAAHPDHDAAGAPAADPPAGAAFYAPPYASIHWAAITQPDYEFPAKYQPHLIALGHVETSTGRVAVANTRSAHFFPKGCNPPVESATALALAGELLPLPPANQLTFKVMFWGSGEEVMRAKLREAGLAVASDRENFAGGIDHVVVSGTADDCEKVHKQMQRMARRLEGGLRCMLDVACVQGVYDLARAVEGAGGEYPTASGQAVVVNVTNDGYPVLGCYAPASPPAAAGAGAGAGAAAGAAAAPSMIFAPAPDRGLRDEFVPPADAPRLTFVKGIFFGNQGEDGWNRINTIEPAELEAITSDFYD